MTISISSLVACAVVHAADHSFCLQWDDYQG